MEVLATSAASTSYSALAWVMITPLGFPVVPDVYSRVTGSDGRIAVTRSATSAGRSACRARPSSSRASQVRYRSSPAGQAAASRTTMARRLGSWSSTGCHRASSLAPLSTAITASQLPATYAICSEARVA